MKKLVIIFQILFLLLASMAGKGQAPHSFGYDASGNRLSRCMYLLKSAGIQSKDSLSQKTFDDLIGNRPVKIYPNPTKGLLKVELPFTEELSATVEIFTLQGALVKKMKVSGTFTEIDLNKQPPGMYMMRIGIGDLSSEWKIIKD